MFAISCVTFVSGTREHYTKDVEQTHPCFCGHLFQSLQGVLLPSSPCPCTTYAYTRRQQSLKPICSGKKTVKQKAVFSDMLFRVNVVGGPNAA